MKIFLLATILSVTLVHSAKIDIVACDGDDLKSRSKVTELDILPCAHPEDDVCDIPEGATSNITIHFTPTDTITDIKSEIKAKVGPLWIPYPIDAKLKDACTSGELKCPPTPGVDNVFNFSFLVSTSYPKIGVVLRWILRDDQGRVQVCAQFPIQVA